MATIVDPHSLAPTPARLSTLAYVGLWIVIAQAFILRRLLTYADYKVLRATLTEQDFSSSRLPPQCVVAVAVRGSVFFRCKRALTSISYDD